MSAPCTTRACRSKVAPFEIDMAVEGGAWDDPGAPLEALARRALRGGVLGRVRPPAGEVEIECSHGRRRHPRAQPRLARQGQAHERSLLPGTGATGRTAPRPGRYRVAFETVAREAEEEGKLFDDHLSHLLVHGLLHLLGTITRLRRRRKSWKVWR